MPFDCSHVYASGNLAADMFANVTAEATGRLLAVRLYNSAKDPGMKDMLSFLIARDTMHQQQWLAVIDETGGSANLPIPNSFDQRLEKQEFSYTFLGSAADGSPPPSGRFTVRPLDGRARRSSPCSRTSRSARSPSSARRRPESGAQRDQITTDPQGAAARGEL